MDKNVPRILSLNLFYPAVLGYFIFVIFFGIANLALIENFRNAFQTDTLLAACKILLVLSTLTFFCSDYINSSLFDPQKFDTGSFLVDMLVMVLLIISFNALKLDAALTPVTKDYFRLDILSGCYCAFMVIYGIRYCVVHSKLSAGDKNWYLKLVVVEIILALIFLALMAIHFLITNEKIVRTAVIVTCGFNLLSTIIYITLIRKRHFSSN